MSKQSIQGLTVNYTNDILQCGICQYIEESDGNIAVTNNCKHTFHICCLINKLPDSDNIYCPICNEKIYDIRLSLALAYKNNDTQKFINILR